MHLPGFELRLSIPLSVSVHELLSLLSSAGVHGVCFVNLNKDKILRNI